MVRRHCKVTKTPIVLLSNRSERKDEVHNSQSSSEVSPSNKANKDRLDKGGAYGLLETGVLTDE